MSAKFELCLKDITVDTFSERAYLCANPDVAKKGRDAKEHYLKYGLKEGRKQVDFNAIGPDSSYRTEKLSFFKETFLDQNISSLPHVCSNEHYDLTQYPGESAHDVMGDFAREIEANPFKKYLDIGCGFCKKVYYNCLYIEVYPSLTADLIVSPDGRYPLRDESFDGIGCFAVLEHVKNPIAVSQEMRRILKPGGRIFIDYPFLQPVHGAPNNYFNATRSGLLSLFSEHFDIESLETRSHQGPDYTVHKILSTLRNGITDPSIKTMFETMTVGDLLKHSPRSHFWSKIVSSIKDSTVEELACGNTLIGKKR